MILAQAKRNHSFPVVAFQMQTATSGDYRRRDEDQLSTSSLIENLEEVVLANAKQQLFSLIPEEKSSDDFPIASSVAIDRALFLLKLVFSGITNAGLQWHEPLISASVDGEVVIEWWRRERKLTIYCGDDSFHYLKTTVRDSHVEIDDGELGSIIELWSWMTIG